MLRTMIIIATSFVTLVITIAACGSTPGTSDVAEQPADALVQPTVLTAPGQPDDRATDVKGYEISDSELQAILGECQENSGMPGVDDNCLGADGRMNMIYHFPCTIRSTACLFTGRLDLDPTRAVVQVDDRRPGKPACSKNSSHGPCAGIVVAARIIEPLTTATQATTSTSASPSSSDTEATSTTMPSTTKPTPSPSWTWPIKTVTRTTQ